MGLLTFVKSIFFITIQVFRLPTMSRVWDIVINDVKVHIASLRTVKDE